MTLIRHLVWHDLRSQRLALTAFGAFLLLDAWATSAVAIPAWRGFASSMVFVRLVLVGLVTGSVIQQDSLVGTSAFWRTRPVSRATLLANKAITLSLALLIVPAIVTWVVWLSLGLHAGDAMLAAGALVTEHATVGLLTAMAAVVTPSFTYLIVAGVAGGTMVSLINSVALPSLLTTWPFVAQSLGGYRPVIYLGSLFVLGVPAVVYQYLRLKDWHTATLVAVALLASTVLTRFWPVVPPSPLPIAGASVVQSSAVTVTLVPNTLTRNPTTVRTRRGPADLVRYSAQVTTDDVPDGVLLWAESVDSRLLLRDRTVTSTERGSRWTRIMPADVTSATDPNLRALNAAVAPARLLEPRPRYIAQNAVHLITVPTDVDRQHAGERALLTSNLTFLATRQRISGRAPAVAGASVVLPGMAIEILSAASDGEKVTLRARIAYVDREMYTRDHRISAGEFGYSRMVLRNARHGQAVQSGAPRFGRRIAIGLGISGIGTLVTKTDLVFDASSALEPVRLDDAWLKSAELVIVGNEAIGTFTRPLQMDLVVGKNGP